MGTRKVLVSIGNSDGTRCVDVFEYPDGFFGFQQFRRDVEDVTGWFPIGTIPVKKYTTKSLAMQAAYKNIEWLHDL